MIKQAVKYSPHIRMHVSTLLILSFSPASLVSEDRPSVRLAINYHQYIPGSDTHALGRSERIFE